ncbi:DNA (cytosine-5)-methyltransferase 3C-like [Dermacentor silvarum]|uniref:DNA (cytosine-5)-methyltransferase 3C-like n=1 Tax=Dermacentor silvarum TaxID=543639 RepID=UPI002100DFCF|nr:DNA (cytosine-5)-methyltransferase 3C-like [Dermacentor silvarum]
MELGRVILARSCTSLAEGTDLVVWALENSSTLAAHVAGSVPMAVQKALGGRPALTVPTTAPLPSSPSGTELCIACDAALPMDETSSQHPMVEGAICRGCRAALLETLFAIAPDGTSAYCFICGNGLELFICDNPECSRCICSKCLIRLVDDREPEKVSRRSPWYCHVCGGRAAGRLRPRPDWEARVLDFFRHSPVAAPPVPPQQSGRSLRVLSLFDGIATGKFVLDHLGLSVEAYYASEVDKDAIHVGLTRHGSSITYLGPVEQLTDQQLKQLCPIDLLIGGSPCSDLALVNPNRKGPYDATGTGILFFEFYRVFRTVQQENGERHLFWMFENVVAMPREYRRIISRFLQCQPTLLDACYFSPQARARLFWGNIPGMYATLNPELVQSISLGSILDPRLNRKAAVQKVRTVTTNPNSLRPSKHGVLPVIMNDEGDVLWTTELEQLFGFPRHYTDVGNISLGKRRQLLGKAWSVPVVCHILRPLRSFFRHSREAAHTTAT